MDETDGLAAILRDARIGGARAPPMRAPHQDEATSCCGISSQPLRRRALALPPSIGIRLTARTTAKVMISIARPRTEIAARSPLSLRPSISTDSTLACDVNRTLHDDSS